MIAIPKHWHRHYFFYGVWLCYSGLLLQSEINSTLRLVKWWIVASFSVRMSHHYDEVLFHSFLIRIPRWFFRTKPFKTWDHTIYSCRNRRYSLIWGSLAIRICEEIMSECTSRLPLPVTRGLWQEVSFDSSSPNPKTPFVLLQHVFPFF